jgi:hypothetical protein
MQEQLQRCPRHLVSFYQIFRSNRYNLDYANCRIANHPEILLSQLPAKRCTILAYSFKMQQQLLLALTVLHHTWDVMLTELRITPARYVFYMQQHSFPPYPSGVIRIPANGFIGQQCSMQEQVRSGL